MIISIKLIHDGELQNNFKNNQKLAHLLSSALFEVLKMTIKEQGGDNFALRVRTEIIKDKNKSDIPKEKMN